MIEWAILPFKRYFDFQGRSRRMEYWSFTLLNVVVYFLFFAVMMAGGFSMAMMEGADGPPPALGPLFFVGAGLLGLYGLAVIIPSIAVAVRRFHDRDMSGWWMLGFVIANAIPLVNFIAGIAFLVLMLLPGTAGPNRFGPDPKDPTSADVFA